MALTDLRPETSPPPSSPPRLARLIRWWPVVSLLVELLIRWFAIRVDLWSRVYLLPLPVLVLILIGIAFVLLPLVVRPGRCATFEEAMARRRRASLMTLVSVAAVAVCIYFFGLPVKMWVSSSSPTRVVDKILPRVASEQDGLINCWRTPSDLDAVSSLMSANKWAWPIQQQAHLQAPR